MSLTLSSLTLMLLLIMLDATVGGGNPSCLKLRNCTILYSIQIYWPPSTRLVNKWGSVYPEVCTLSYSEPEEWFTSVDVSKEDAG